ncbi:type I polyketide synthase [Aspergillus candidus]|uniref:Putative polyketide synthase n=1 Tax=Aspergillus candidus TaxID=41067 RepID=A0A2I2FGE5_ASPCN|nr:putative polyketide synthase [Aspergillus candidus]PLB39701.1 putative polyketide synthase [Aspergillus candidus]
MRSPDPQRFGDATEPIAIVGMACRFPGEASTLERFWDMIVNGRTGHSAVPPDRFDAEAWYHPSHERKGTIQPRSGFFLEESSAVFDAPFFSMTANEAAGMDPMQRKSLEIAYEAFENAGIPIGTLPGSATGVYTGVMTNDYELMTAGDPMQLPQNAASGTSRAMLSNRISWFFDLRGPSFALDTACSSSLYALHLACQSLRTGESRQALVTSVNLILAPNFISQLSSMHMLSPDGKSHSFDSRANGYARGEALAAVVVKTLHQALEDGDTIRAVIRGSGANQDGKTVGITIPNGEAQADLIHTTYATAGLDLNHTGYFEAHGTGTSVGDPIELSAIGGSFGTQRSTDNPLVVGSVKTNIGHTEGAAGLAGVIKAVLAVEQGVIPPLPEFKELNPKLRLDEWRLALPLTPTPWPTAGLRRASVNSFGFGGANAHVILDDAYHYLRSHGLKGMQRTVVPEKDDSSDSGLSIPSDSSDADGEESTNTPVPRLFVFSTYDGGGIRRMEASWASFLAKHVSDNSKQRRHMIADDDLAYTLSQRRTTFDFRSFAVASTLPALTSKIEQDGLPRLNRVSRHLNPIFVFTGQGAQWPAMGRELLSDPIFRASIDRSRNDLESAGCQWDILALLSDPADRRIDGPAFSQPVCTIVQIALVDLLRSWSVQPAATVGHSSGEVAAAYAANLLSQADAVRIGYWRGFYSEQVKDRMGECKGAMMAVGLSETQAVAYLDRVPEGSVVVACVNSPASVTLSGDASAINHLEAVLHGDGHFARKLRVQVAYHSPHMRVVADAFVQALGKVQPQASDIPMFSSVTEKRIDDPSVLQASYWMQNLVSPVRFSGALTNLLSHTPGGNPRRRRVATTAWSALVEIGPHEALKGPCRQIMSAWDGKSPERIPYMSLLSRGKHARETALAAAGMLWASGHPVDLRRVNQCREGLQMVVPDLPPYAWNHEKGFWHEPAASMSARLRKEPRNDLLGMPVPHQNPFERSWRNYLSVSECPWQRDHIITGTVLYPGAGHLIMAFEAAQRLASPDRALAGVEFCDVHFDKGLVIPSGDQAVETLLATRPHEKLSDWYHYTVYSVNEDSSWTKHSWSTFSLHYDGVVSSEQCQRYHRTYKALRSRAAIPLDIPSFYDQLQSIGTEYGPTFRNMVEAAAVPGERSGVGTIAIPNTRAVIPHEFEYPHLIHPATLDAIFHLIFVAMSQGQPLAESAIPTKVDRLFISTDLPTGAGAVYTGYSHTESLSGRDTQGTIVVSDESWPSGPKIIVERMTVTEVSSGASSQSSPVQSSAGQGRIATLDWREDLDTLVGPMAVDCLARKASKAPNPLMGESDAVRHLHSWLDLACFKNADWKVLVVEPTTWGGSSVLLEIFASKTGGRYRFAQTVIAESKAEATHQIEQRLSQGGLDVTYTTVDLFAGVDEETVAQLGTFDLILAPYSLVNQLPHLEPLLRSEGRMALVSTGTKDDHDESSSGDVLHTTTLQETIRFRSGQDNSGLCIASLESKHDPANDFSEIVLLQHADPAASSRALGEQLTTRLSALGHRVRTTTLSEAQTLSGHVVISLLEAERPFVISWTSDDFEQFRQLTSAQYLLWVTHGGLLETQEASLAYSPSTGLLRTVRAEKPQIRLPHLDLTPGLDVGSEQAVDLILKVFGSTSKAPVNGKNCEMEYAELNGLLHIPRAQGHHGLDHELALHAATVISVPGPLYQPGTSRKLEACRAGDASSLWWIPDERDRHTLTDTEIELQPTHIALEDGMVKEFLSSKQRALLPPALGRTAVGTVTDVGPLVSRFAPGDRVLTLHPGPFHTHLRMSESLVHKLPESLSPGEAAVVPLVAAHAWHVLVEVAAFRAGQTVFVNGSGDILSRLLVQLVQSLHGEVFVSVSSKEERHALMEDHHIPANRIFNQLNPASWTSDILAAADGNGLDVINNTTAGSTVRSLSASVKSGGRFVDVTQKVVASMLDPTVFERGITLSFLNLTVLPDSKLFNLVDKALNLARMGRFNPMPSISLSSVSELPHALTALVQEEGSSPTPMVIEFPQDATVPLLPSPPPPLHLKPEATYILAGGLGALGLTIADNLWAHGARHLVFLSRSGASSLRQQEALQSLREHGCAVDVVRCDVTDAEQVKALAAQIQEKSWKVKGVVQLAMVLRDSIFENMTFDKWLTAVNPKVKGTWNLHNYLPQELDFFVILSSLSGIIGNTAQANYCAGNTYEDALAHYRRKLGLAATTLNVGLVTDASHFNEDSTIEDYLRKYSHWIPAQVTDRELQKTLIAVMRGQLAEGEPVPGQLLVGLSDQVRRDGESLNLWPLDRKFDHRISLAGVTTTAQEESPSQQLQDSQTASEAQALVEWALRVNVANAMTASPDDIDVEKPLYTFGIDSLKAIEVGNWIFKELKADISVFEVLSPISLGRLAMKIVSKSSLVSVEVATEAAAEGSS